MAGHEPPRATEPHIYWYGQSSELVDRLTVLEARWRTERDGQPRDPVGDLHAVLWVEWNPRLDQPAPPGAPRGRGHSSPPPAVEPGS